MSAPPGTYARLVTAFFLAHSSEKNCMLIKHNEGVLWGFSHWEELQQFQYPIYCGIWFWNCVYASWNDMWVMDSASVWLPSAAVEKVASVPSDTENTNLWIVVGVVIPLLVVIIIISILYWKLCRTDKLEFQPDAMTSIQQRQKVELSFISTFLLFSSIELPGGGTTVIENIGHIMGEILEKFEN